ncbi:zinc finger protein 628-like [Sitophilus oryzae]|uniref:Zinc finger protein 628-like n=1 Tax=Sitophilus oryzae TaxID=7048 RepID=A0A6J2YT14_SITOR|nr:zinc finger protein 628-like [Sitophilus oryzae]
MFRPVTVSLFIYTTFLCGVLIYFNQPSLLEWLEFDKIVMPPSLDHLLLNPVSARCQNSRRDRKCPRVFTDEYVRHGYSHDSQFACRHCGKRYRWKSTMRRHEQVECGGKEPTFKCPKCPYRAKQKGNLGVHIRKHHSSDQLFCNDKKKDFLVQALLASQISINNNNNNANTTNNNTNSE